MTAIELADIEGGTSRWLDVVGGLIVSDIKSRFAAGRLGYAWAYLGPIVWIAGLIWFFEILGHTPSIVSSTPYFVMTGILPYVIFRQSISSLSRCLSAARNVIGFGGIRASDVLFATTCLEAVNALNISIMILLVLAVVFGLILPDDPLLFVGGLAMAWMLGASFGRLSAIAGANSDFLARTIPLALRPMFWISGIFFTMSEVPQSLRDVLWWNPLIHAVETTRSGFFQDFHSEEASLLYPLLFNLCLWQASLGCQYLFSRNRNGTDLQ